MKRHGKFESIQARSKVTVSDRCDSARRISTAVPLRRSTSRSEWGTTGSSSCRCETEIWRAMDSSAADRMSASAVEKEQLAS